MHDTLDVLRRWMRSRGWRPLPHQEETWKAQIEDREGLVCVPTGSGKTYSAWFGALARAVGEPGLCVLWITPLRAMARDIERALARPVAELGLDATVASRTGDTSAWRKRKLRERLPTALLTTPESLSLMLSYEDAPEVFSGVQTVVVDEWHELAGNKRGTQTELALARIRTFSPTMRTWALSATLGNVEELARAVVGEGREPTIVRADAPRSIVLRSILGPSHAQLPWFGFLGTTMVDAVVAELDPARSTLLFTNTRNQAERWFHAILERRPEWAERAALHHGSIDGEERERVERGLADGSITLVVCTSSLDLGVDFAPVERVVQIGSPRGIARLLQRAGRSGHRPGASSEVDLVPTHAMQLAEIAALRVAIARGDVEPRHPLRAPFDVLVQHMVTCALGGGFSADGLFDEVKRTHAYRSLDRATFERVLALVEHGGATLGSYPEYHRVVRENGRFTVVDARIARSHRIGIGTITQDGVLRVRFQNGQTLGHVDERFLGRLAKGERFLFAGRTLEIVAMRDMDVTVRLAPSGTAHAPKWQGGRLPLSESLARVTRELLVDVRERLGRGASLAPLGPEMERAEPLFRFQAAVSVVPGERPLAEITTTAEGSHLFLFPFGGHLAHAGLAALLAYRLGRRHEATFALSVHDYGIELLAAGGIDFELALEDASVFDVERLEEDALAAVNAAELGRRQFREIARVAGLVIEGPGRQRKTTRQLQTSAGLLHDVFARYEPDHLLLAQARREVLERHFDRDRLARILLELRDRGPEVVRTRRPSPMAFPLLLDRVEARVSSESARRRIERMKERWLAETAR